MSSENASGAELLVEVNHLLGGGRPRPQNVPYTTSASPSEQTYEPSPDAFTRESRSATAPYDEQQIRELESDVYQDFLENSNWFLPEGTAKLLALQKRLQDITTSAATATSPGTHQSSSRRHDSSTARRSSVGSGSVSKSSPRESAATNRGNRLQGTSASMQPTNLAYHRTPQQHQQHQQYPVQQTMRPYEASHPPSSAGGGSARQQHASQNHTPRGGVPSNAPITTVTVPTTYVATMEQYLPEPVNAARYTEHASAIREVLIETLGSQHEENVDEEDDNDDYADAPETSRTPIASSHSSTTRNTGRRDADMSTLPSTAQSSARSRHAPTSPHQQQDDGKDTVEREQRKNGEGEGDGDDQAAILSQLVEFIRAECAQVAMPRALFYDVERECRRAHVTAEENLLEAVELLHDEREWIDTRCGVLQDRLNDLERRRQCVVRALGNIQVP